jgi:hypothetical protein
MTARPAILGGIFDTLSRAMKIFPTVKLDNLPRMADFTLWGYAIAEALGGYGQQFLDEYAENRENQNAEAINNDTVATLVVEFMRDRTEWNGTIENLRKQLMTIAANDSVSTNNKTFPQDATRLSRRLNGIKSNLKGVGITFSRGDGRQRRSIFLKAQNIASPVSQRHQPSNCNAFLRDATVTLSDSDNLSVTHSVTGKPLRRNSGDTGDAGDTKNRQLREVVI